MMKANKRQHCIAVVLLLALRKGEGFHAGGLPGLNPHRQHIARRDHQPGQTCLRLPSSLHVQQRPQQQSSRQNYSSKRRGRGGPPPPAVRQAIERNKKIVALGKQRRVDDLFELFEKERKSFSHVNFATMLMQLQRIPSRMGRQRRNDPRLQDLLMEIGNHLQRPDTSTKWGAREISNVVYAMSKLTDFRANTEAKNILDFIESDVVLTKVVQQGNAHSIANILLAFVKQGYDSPVVFESAERHIDRLFVEGNSQDIANTLWAFAKQRYDSPVVFKSAERHIDRVVEAGNAQSIANTLWAFAKQGYDSDVVFKAAERHIDRVLSDGNSQSIANIVWGYATHGYDSDVVFAAAERHIDRLFVEGNSQEIANTLWAFAKQGYDSDVVFEAAERHIDRVVVDGSSQEIANTLWAFATQGYDSAVVFTAAERHIDRVFVDGNSQNIANILWAFATQGYDSAVVFAAAERHIDRLFVEGNSQEMANILWAFAKQGYDSDVVFEAAERHIDRLLDGGIPQSIANILWAFAIQGWTGTADQRITFQSLWNKAKSSNWDEMSDEGKWQFLGAYILTIPDLTLDVPQAWLNESQMLGQKNVESRWQGNVSSLLSAIGFEHELEVDPVPHLIPGYLAIDIACSASKIAIELDGPSHYLRNVHRDKTGTPAEDGSTKAKRRLLTRLGWRVINIPYFEWHKLNSCTEKESYLSAIVAKVATSEFCG